MSLDKAFRDAGVDQLAIAQQKIKMQEETIRELEFDNANLQRQLMDMGQRFAKITNRNWQHKKSYRR